MEASHGCSIVAMPSASSPKASLIATTRPGVPGVGSGLEIVKVRDAMRRGRLKSMATWASRMSMPVLSASRRCRLMLMTALGSVEIGEASFVPGPPQGATPLTITVYGDTAKVRIA